MIKRIFKRLIIVLVILLVIGLGIFFFVLPANAEMTAVKVSSPSPQSAFASTRVGIFVVCGPVFTA